MQVAGRQTNVGTTQNKQHNFYTSLSTHIQYQQLNNQKYRMFFLDDGYHHNGWIWMDEPECDQKKNSKENTKETRRRGRELVLLRREMNKTKKKGTHIHNLDLLIDNDV